MAKEMISISEIAKICQLSKVTAARVLSPNNKIKVADVTRKRVLEIAKKFNYRPNRVASSFSSGKTQMIGLIGYSLSDHFLGGIFTGIHEFLYPLGYDFQLLLWSHHLRAKDRLLQSIVDRRLDGVIIAQDDESIDYQYLNELQIYGIPVVAVDREVPIPDISFVGSDDFGGAMDATEHLINAGHKKIVFAGGTNREKPVLSTTRRRLEGYREAMIRNNLRPLPEWLFEYKGDRAANQEYLKNKLQEVESPTAVFANNDSIAADIVVSAHELGIKIPENLSVVGFSDEPISRVVNPALTTIRQEPNEIGRKASEILLKRINDKNPGQGILENGPEKIYLPTTLIERNSVRKIN